MDNFVTEYFSDRKRRILFIAGAGFDPRSTAVAARLAAVCTSIRAVLLQEIRPNPTQGLLERASTNTAELLAAIADCEVVPIEIFGTDGAVVGGA